MTQEEIHDRYCDIVAINWTAEEFENFSREIRKHFLTQIVERDGQDGIEFARLWVATFELDEEVTLSGEATAVISHPWEDA